MVVSFPQSRQAFKTGLHAVLNTVFPYQCLSCDARVEVAGAVCGQCWRELRFLEGNLCNGCGCPLAGFGDGTADLCDDCLSYPRPWTQGCAAIEYSGTGRKIVLSLKHGDRQDVVLPAARWMAKAGKPALETATVLTPVPLHPLRMLKRRFNQAALLSSTIARETGITGIPDALLRIRQTPVSDGMSRDARAASLSGAISVSTRNKHLLCGAHVVVVDDVMTTGATLTACADAIHAAGAREVSVLVLARVLKDH